MGDGEPGCCARCWLKILTIIAHIIRVAAAIAIICIVAIQLYDYTDNGFLTEPICLISSGESNMCEYCFALAGLSLAIELALSIFLCLTCDLCGLGPVLEACFCGVATAWWLAGSLVITNEVAKANDAGYGENYLSNVDQWRNAVAILCWINFGLFAFMCLVYIGKMIAACCSCCCGGKKDLEKAGAA